MSPTEMFISVSDLHQAALSYVRMLAPLGYRYAQRAHDRIVFSADRQPSVVLERDATGEHAGGDMVVLTASDRRRVQDFYAAALAAGARARRKPAGGEAGGGVFRASVTDRDGNVVKVVCPGAARSRIASVAGSSAGRRAGAPSSKGGREPEQANDSGRSVGSRGRSNTSRVRLPSKTSSQAVRLPRSGKRSTEIVSVDSVFEVLQRSLLAGRNQSQLSNTTIEVSTKALAGALIGAATGAALAFAACKSEEESAQAEIDASMAELSLRKRQQNSGDSRRKAKSQTSRGVVYPAPSAGPFSRQAIRTVDSRSRIREIEDSKPRSKSGVSGRSSTPTVTKSRSRVPSISHNPSRSQVRRKDSRDLPLMHLAHPLGIGGRVPPPSHRLGSAAALRAQCERRPSPPAEFLHFWNQRGETRTVVPDDSISMVGVRRSRVQHRPLPRHHSGMREVPPVAAPLRRHHAKLPPYEERASYAVPTRAELEHWSRRQSLGRAHTEIGIGRPFHRQSDRLSAV